MEDIDFAEEEGDYESGKTGPNARAQRLRVNSLTATRSPNGTKTFDLNLGFNADADAFRNDDAAEAAELEALAGSPGSGGGGGGSGGGGDGMGGMLSPEKPLVMPFGDGGGGGGGGGSAARRFEQSDSDDDSGWGTGDDDAGDGDGDGDAGDAGSAEGMPSPTAGAAAGAAVGAGEKFSGNFDWGEVSAAQQLTRQNAELLGRLDEQKATIANLEMAMSCAAPVPGLDPSKFIDVMEGTEMVDQDVRDVKIVELAKRARSLNVAMQAEKARKEKAQAELKSVRAELELMGSAAARAAARKGTDVKSDMARGGAAADNDAAEETPLEQLARMRKEKARLQKRGAALQRAHEQAQQELKRTQRCLAKEVGEGVLERLAGGETGAGGLGIALEKMLAEDEGSNKIGGGWKGRAQQIVMLKNKLKRAEAERDSALAATAATAATAANTGSPSHTKAGMPSSRFQSTRRGSGHAGNVDEQAQAALDDMGAQRREAVEELTSRNEELENALTAAARRTDAARARARVLDMSAKKQTQQLKTLLGKSKMDDELVAAQTKQLQAAAKEINTLKKALVEANAAEVEGAFAGRSAAGACAEGSPQKAAAAHAAAVREARRDAKEREDVRRIEKQEGLISSLRREISSLRDQLAAPQHARPRRPTTRETAERVRAADATIEAQAVLAKGRAAESEERRLRELTETLKAQLAASEERGAAAAAELRAHKKGQQRDAAKQQQQQQHSSSPPRGPRRAACASSSRSPGSDVVAAAAAAAAAAAGAGAGGAGEDEVGVSPETSKEVEELRRKLADALEENDSIRASFHATLAASEAEVASARRSAEEQRREFERTIGEMREHVKTSVARAATDGALSAYNLSGAPPPGAVRAAAPRAAAGAASASSGGKGVGGQKRAMVRGGLPMAAEDMPPDDADDSSDDGCGLSSDDDDENQNTQQSRGPQQQQQQQQRSKPVGGRKQFGAPGAKGGPQPQQQLPPHLAALLDE